MKYKLLTAYLFSILLLACSSDVGRVSDDDGEAPLPIEFSVNIPAGANSWVNNINADLSIIKQSGVRNWSHKNDVIKTYFRTNFSGELHLGLKLRVANGTSKIKVSFGSQSREIEINNNQLEAIDLGKFTIANAGYQLVEIQGISKTGHTFADIDEVLIAGRAVYDVSFVPTSNFHFGRRGPSVHLNYTLPQNEDVTWFYNEVTVPVGADKVGSFFMANGHAEGYFGMQVNSEFERRILFSIWSGFETDSPNQVPEEWKVINLSNGNGVTVQDFGNEGSGKQCILRFDWQAGTTYKFLIKGEPSTNNSTKYSAYFYAPENGTWQLIARLQRPMISTHLTRLHSFLENFIPATGVEERMANYHNQWIYTLNNNWVELNKATFTADATATANERLDYAGGENGEYFYLKNCGFFNEKTQIRSFFTRQSSNTPPTIDFNSLEDL
jgi:hypothetical protein